MAVRALVPPPVVMIATTGTCSIPKYMHLVIWSEKGQRHLWLEGENYSINTVIIQCWIHCSDLARKKLWPWFWEHLALLYVMGQTATEHKAAFSSFRATGFLFMFLMSTTHLFPRTEKRSQPLRKELSCSLYRKLQGFSKKWPSMLCFDTHLCRKQRIILSQIPHHPASPPPVGECPSKQLQPPSSSCKWNPAPGHTDQTPGVHLGLPGCNKDQVSYTTLVV